MGAGTASSPGTTSLGKNIVIPLDPFCGVTGVCHAAQGDGEVCVTGIESPMEFTLRFNLVKARTCRPRSSTCRAR